MDEVMSVETAHSVLRQHPLGYWGGMFFWPYKDRKDGDRLREALGVVYPEPWEVAHVRPDGFTGQAVIVILPKEETC